MIDASIRERLAAAAADPAQRQFLEDLYASGDRDGERFAASAEFAEVVSLLGGRLGSGVTVVDVGAGTGAASYAFAKTGATVVAVEPEPGEYGRDAVMRNTIGLKVTVLPGTGEQLPLPDESADIVYCRQMLHHAADLSKTVSECARVLRPGGIFVACREPVVFSNRGRRRWLKAHEPWLHEGEQPYRPAEYRKAVAAAGLTLQLELGHFASVINAFPAVRSNQELAGYAGARLAARLPMAAWIAGVPGVDKALKWVALKRLAMPCETFVACKP